MPSGGRPEPERARPDQDGDGPAEPSGRAAPGAATLAARAARDARLERQARRSDAARAARDRPAAGVTAAVTTETAAGWRWALAAALGLLVVGLVAFWLWPRGPAAEPALPLAGAPPAPAPVPKLLAKILPTPTVTQASAVVPVPVPVMTLSELLATQTTGWRQARLRELPAVLAIEFPDLAEQGAAMNRIAALLEKAGAPRDRVLGDAELAALIKRSGDNSQTFYQGHDYDSAGLARFFARVTSQRLKLNASEERLRRELLAGGVLQADGAVLKPAGDAPQALITFTSTQPDDPKTPFDEAVDAVRRESVLRHEASHGRFYTQPSYREHCHKFWREAFNDAQRERFRVFLAGAGYNRDDEELMINEAQAFLLHTPDARAFTEGSIGASAGELEALRARFWRTLPAEPVAFSPTLAPAAAASR